MNSNLNWRIIRDRLFQILIFALAFLATLPLFLILFYIVKNGIACLNWQFLVSLPKPAGEVGGGIVNCLVGTMLLIVLAGVFSIPLGIIVGIYLSEYPQDRLAYFVRLCTEVIAGTPSIVIGIIAYLWVVIPMGGFSLLSGAIALSIIMLPPIIRTTEETLRLIPPTLKEASLALGVPYHKTILKVIFPAGLSGIITGILLSVARVSGETAPLLFTAFGSPYLSYHLLKPVNSLPLLIFNYATSPYETWQQAAWGASLVLIIQILALNIFSKVVAKRWKIQF